MTFTANFSDFIESTITTAPALLAAATNFAYFLLFLSTLAGLIMLFKPLLSGIWYASKLYIKQYKNNY